MLAVLIVASGAARAEPVFTFDATPGKLKASSRGGARIVCASRAG
ncbi:hypothetical protein [Bradyrhizobium sp.]|nr:hypothetical protein [Bradyrhizobium sp.]